MRLKFWESREDDDDEHLVVDGIPVDHEDYKARLSKGEVKSLKDGGIKEHSEAVEIEDYEASDQTLIPPSDDLLETPQRRKGRLPGEKKLVEQYLAKISTQKRSQTTIKEYRLDLKFWCQYAREVAGKHPLNLSIEDLDRALQWMAEERGNGPAIIRRRVSSFRSFCRWVKGRKNLPTPPVELVDRPELDRTEPRELGQEQFLKIRDECRNKIKEDRIYCWTAVMLIGGLRVSEMASIRVIDGRLKVKGKGGKERSVPVPEWVWRGVKYHQRKHRKKFEASRHTVWRLVKKQWDGVHPHQFRHTYGSELWRRGKREGEIQKLMGHASITSTMIYVKIDLDGSSADLLDE